MAEPSLAEKDPAGQSTLKNSKKVELYKDTMQLQCKEHKIHEKIIETQQKFAKGENVVGLTSGARAVVNDYQGNPIQNIQQLVCYGCGFTLIAPQRNYLRAVKKTTTIATNIKKEF